MLLSVRAIAAGLCLLGGLASPLVAQIDYRNLDDERPVTSEDAYPVDYRAVELLTPITYEATDGQSLYLVAPELESGLFRNTQVGAKLPVAALADGGTTAGFAGLKLYGLYNFNTESPSLSAFAIRADLDLPVGALAGNSVRATLKAIATRSWGRSRLHVNLMGTVGGSSGTAVDALPRWAATAAVDHTLYRQSLLLLGEIATLQETADAPTSVIASLGMRWQWRPTAVLDAGISRRLTASGPDVALTVGVSQSFGRRPPTHTPGIPPARLDAARLDRRDDHFYYPGSWNFQFLKQYPQGARLFNAFDYGHAVLYEKLLTLPDSAALGRALAREYDYLTTDLLRHPPRYAVAEEAIEPHYAKLAWKAKQMFDWAHVLHRQLYDIYMDPRLEPAMRDSLVERITDAYLARSDYAFTPLPKSMALMDDQSFSQVFRRQEPRFNGLIWAYHWLQVGLYEPLVTDTQPAARRAGLDSTLARFWAMLDDPARMPVVMPMTSAVAPRFAAAHPRAAVIFDNLHMMHDIISDILVAPGLSPPEKRRVIYEQLDEFRDGTRNVITMDEWRSMGEMMGGVDLMGGEAGIRHVGPRERDARPRPDPGHQHH